MFVTLVVGSGDGRTQVVIEDSLWQETGSIK